MNRLIEQEEGTYQGVQAHDSKQFPACGLCRYFQNPLHGRLKQWTALKKIEEEEEQF